MGFAILEQASSPNLLSGVTDSVSSQRDDLVVQQYCHQMRLITIMMCLFAKDIIINHLNTTQEKMFLVKLSKRYKLVIKHEQLETDIIFTSLYEHMVK